MNSAGRHYAGGQIVGRRNRQEDVFGVSDLPGDSKSAVLVVADGMGGYAGGAEAADIAVRGFLERFESADGDIAQRLHHAAEAANAAVAELKRHTPNLDSAGCTLVAVVVEGGAVSWISVGDSPFFRLRDGVLERLNADHSMRPVLEDMVAAGRMTIDEVNVNPNRNALRSAVTGEDIDLVDVQSGVPLQAGDQLLLASDGLNVLPPERIAQILAQKTGSSLDDTVAALLEEVEALGAPRQDNTTIVLYRAGETMRAKDARPFWTARKALVLAAAVIVAGAALWLATAQGRAYTQNLGWHWFMSGSAHPASGKK